MCWQLGAAALEAKCRAFQESARRLGECVIEVRLATCDVAAHVSGSISNQSLQSGTRGTTRIHVVGLRVGGHCFSFLVFPVSQLAGCAGVFNRRGFLSFDNAAIIDFDAIKGEIEGPSEAIANEAWDRSCQAVQSLSKLRLAQVCEDVVQKLQTAAATLESKVEETQEELKEKCKELDGKNA